MAVAEAEAAGEVVAAGAKSESSVPGATLSPWTLLLVLYHAGHSCCGLCQLGLTRLAMALYRTHSHFNLINFLTCHTIRVINHLTEEQSTLFTHLTAKRRGFVRCMLRSTSFCTELTVWDIVMPAALSELAQATNTCAAWVSPHLTSLALLSAPSLSEA